MIDIFYRRPGTAASSTSSLRSVSSCTWEIPRPGIPESLSFDRIVNGKTCSPCSLYDFVSYLRHVEHNFESLKFYMWHMDYTRRFESLPASERGLSPEWRRPPPAVRRPRNESTSKSIMTTATNELFDEDVDGGDIKMVFSESVEVEYPSASLQPFRDEISKIISLYLLPTSPYQLNLSSNDLTTCLRGLAHTTHPSAFLTVFKSVSINLRLQSHPAFISFSLRNANPARLTMIRVFSFVNILAAILTAVLLILSKHHRVARMGCFVPTFFGTLALFNSYRGLCTILLFLGFKRNNNAWEKFRQEERGNNITFRDEEETTGDEAESDGVLLDDISDPGRLERERAFIANYLKKPARSRAYDFSSVQNSEVRRLQISMLAQSAIVGATAGGIYVGILMAMPVVGLF